MQTKTNYKSNYKSTLSPFHKQMQDKNFDYQNPKHPVNQEIIKNVGTFNFTATIQQDTQTLDRFKHIRGLVAFICTLKRDGITVGEGRGTTVLDGQINKFVTKTIKYAFNASLIDAIVRSVKSLDTFTIKQTKPQETPFSIEDLDKQETEMITDSQKRYLLELVHLNIPDEEQKLKWESNLDDFTKAEASEAISNFKN